MEEAIIDKLSNFGLTVNQAKVYVSIVQYGKTHVSQISKETQLHRQDIYKLLPKLEKMGLITKTIDQPFMIEAIPVEKALDSLVWREKMKADERISHLENNLKDVVNSLRDQPRMKEETQFALLSTDETIRNRERLSFKKLKKEFLFITNIEHLKSSLMPLYREFLQTIADNKAKTRLIVVTNDDEDTVEQTIRKIAPTSGQFIAKSIDESTRKNYRILDNKEVWISTKQKTETGHPAILWTNDQNVVDVYKENFKKAWSRARAALTLGITISSVICIAATFLDLLDWNSLFSMLL
ncbi:MAG TPA: helix-turn-helix domain-containing protein [Candidatus Binatia bacterium]|nr:helix-turn-helix domain-containing protein [Candidatus Binatia bacterium]